MGLQERFNGFRRKLELIKLPARCIIISDVHASSGDDGDPLKGSGMERELISVLEDYFKRGYSLIKLGDWWDVWRAGSLTNIARAHRKLMTIIDLKYRDSNRLYETLGNHERDSCSYPEALIFRGYGKKIFVDHGYFEDWPNEAGWKMARQLVMLANKTGVDPESSPHPENEDRHMAIQEMRHRLARDNPTWDFFWGHTHFFEDEKNNHNSGSILNGRMEGYLIDEGEVMPLERR